MLSVKFWMSGLDVGKICIPPTIATFLPKYCKILACLVLPFITNALRCSDIHVGLQGGQTNITISIANFGVQENDM